MGEKGGLKYFEFNVISPSIELLIGTQEGTGQDKLDSNSRVLRPQSWPSTLRQYSSHLHAHLYNTYISYFHLPNKSSFGLNFHQPDTPTTGHRFHFSSSFFLELFLCSSPVACWTPTNLAGSPFNDISFWLFMLFMGFSRQEHWRGLPFPSPVDHILSQLSTMTRPSWVALYDMAHSFI